MAAIIQLNWDVGSCLATSDKTPECEKPNVICLQCKCPKCLYHQFCIVLVYQFALLMVEVMQ